MKSYNCVVCVKQVPDTQKVSGDAMKADGTINRAALPAIFNPEDRNALEAALQVKEKFGGTVTVVTMGLPAAAAILRASLACGADRAILLTDRKAAGSDTLATSYILSQAVRKLNPDMVFCGRQAIDGDTAQVGPQIGEKLDCAVVTYLEKIVEVKGEGEGQGGEVKGEGLGLGQDVVTVVRDIGTGVETCRVKLPALFTVTERFGELRPSDMRRVMKYKNAEVETWSCDDVGCDATRCGFAGSPTSVNKIESVVLKGGAFKEVPPTEEGLGALVSELIAEHTIG